MNDSALHAPVPSEDASALAKAVKATEGLVSADSMATLQAIIKAQRIEPIPSPGSYDRGWSFPPHATDMRVMKELQDRAALGYLPTIADVGAGLGAMTWNLVSTCATVVAIERHRDAAVELSKRVTERFRVLFPSLMYPQFSLSDVFKVFITDVCGQYCGTKLRNNFDIIWCGNVIHQQRPEQVPFFLQRLFSMLKPGGKLFLTAHTPSCDTLNVQSPNFLVQETQQFSIRLFREQQLAKDGRHVRFPGFMCQRTTLTKLIVPRTPDECYNDAPQYEGTWRVDAVALPDTLGVEVLPGMIAMPTTVHTLDKHFPKERFQGGPRFHSRLLDHPSSEPDTGTLVEIINHTVVHFFDRPTLLRELCTAGFNVTYSTYTNDQGMPFVSATPHVHSSTHSSTSGLCGTEPTDDEFECNILGIHIEAVKPMT